MLNSECGRIFSMSSRYQILIVFLFLTGIVFPQISKDQLKNELNDLIKDPFFNSATIALDVYDLTGSEYLYRFNQDKLQSPASNMKLLTSAAGLVFLGPRYNFITSVQYTGEIKNKILDGDLYVIGGFDPDFSTADLETFIKDIKKAGITEITGNIYADVSKKDSVIWGRGWMWDDDQSTNAPYLSALNINSNSIDIYITGTSQGEKANVFTDPQTQYVKVINNTVTSSVNPQEIRVTRDWRNSSNDIYVNGYIMPPEFVPGDTVKSSVNIFRPDLYFLALFKERIERSGIKVDGEIKLQKKPQTAKWLSVFSRQYDAVMDHMNKHSDNLSAEMTLYSLAASFNLYPVSAKQGLKIIDSLLVLAGVKDDNYIIADGSGVSRYNLLSAAQILSVLKYMYTEAPEVFLLYYMSLPVAGIDGTLKSRMNNNAATGKVHAKTGTLQGVSCLSGYIIAKNKHLIAFSILEQNYVDKTSYARYIQDQICELIANYD